MSRIPQSLFDAAAVNRPLRGRVAIAGAATYGCGEAPGMDDMTLLVRAAQAAGPGGDVFAELKKTCDSAPSRKREKISTVTSTMATSMPRIVA